MFATIAALPPEFRDVIIAVDVVLVSPTRRQGDLSASPNDGHDPGFRSTPADRELPPDECDVAALARS